MKSMGLEKCGLTSWGDSETKDFLSRRQSGCIHGAYPYAEERVLFGSHDNASRHAGTRKAAVFLLWIQK